MAKSKHRMLSGTELLCFLQDKPDHLPIKRLELTGNLLGYVSRELALKLIRDDEYVGKCGVSRVLYIRQNDKRKTNIAVPEYWDGRACGLYRWWNDTSAQGTRANSVKAWGTWANREPQPA